MQRGGSFVQGWVLQRTVSCKDREDEGIQGGAEGTRVLHGSCQYGLWVLYTAYENAEYCVGGIWIQRLHR